jgi:hypothetical protein
VRRCKPCNRASVFLAKRNMLPIPFWAIRSVNRITERYPVTQFCATDLFRELLYTEMSLSALLQHGTDNLKSYTRKQNPSVRGEHPYTHLQWRSVSNASQ